MLIRRPRQQRPTEGAVDRDRLRAAMRLLRRASLLEIVDRAIDLVPASQLGKLAKGLSSRQRVQPEADLVDAVKRFRDASHRGEYYDDFQVNSKNYMEKSRGTEAWIAECERLFERCAKAGARLPAVKVREALTALMELLKHVDGGHDDVVFWADEGGSWEVGVDWARVLRVWFRCLAATAGPEEYAREVVGAVDRFAGYDRERHLKRALAVGAPEQRTALLALAEGS